MGEFVSLSEHSIDLGPGGTTGGSAVKLLKSKSADVKDDSDVDVLTTIGVLQGAGFRNKPGGGSIDITVIRETGLPEVNWLALKLDRKTFRYIIEDEGGGLSVSFVCRVAQVDLKSEDNGTNEMTVKLKYTKLFLN